MSSFLPRKHTSKKTRFASKKMASVTKMDVVENDSIRKPKTYVETNRKFKRLTLVNNNNGKIGLEILLISDRSLLGTNNTGGDDDDDFAKDGKKTRKQNRNQTRRRTNLDRTCRPQKTIQRTSEKKGQKKG